MVDRSKTALLVAVGSLSVVGLMYLLSSALIFTELLGARSGGILPIVFAVTMIEGFVAMIAAVWCVNGVVEQPLSLRLHVTMAAMGAILWSLPPFISLAIIMSAGEAPSAALSLIIASNAIALAGALIGTITAALVTSRL